MTHRIPVLLSHQGFMVDSLFTIVYRNHEGGFYALVHVGKNGFEHNNLAIFELKLHWVPQNFLGGSTWECVLLHEEMKII